MAKTNKKENFKDMTEGELAKQLAIFREKARVIRFKAEGSKSKNVKEAFNLRRNIARILTAMGAKKSKKQ